MFMLFLNHRFHLRLLTFKPFGLALHRRRNASANAFLTAAEPNVVPNFRRKFDVL